MASSYIHMCRLESMFCMEWMSGRAARSLRDLQLYVKVTELHSLPLAAEPSRCVGAGCTFSAFCVPRTAPRHYQWSVSGS